MSNAIGIDLGGTNIKYAVLNVSGKIHFESIMLTEADKGREQVIHNIKKAIDKALSFALKNSLEILGIGIGTPGIIDNGLVLGGAENLP